MQNFFVNLYKLLLGRVVSRQLSNPTGMLSAKVGKEMNISNENLYHHIIGHSAFGAHRHVLEIGFGNGHFFSEMFKANKELKISGVESSKAMLAQAKKKYRLFLKDEKIQLHPAKAGLPFGDAYFQAVIAVNLVYFWKDVSKEIAELHRCLELGGLVYIGIRPKHILKNLPFAGKQFNIQPESWWINQFEGKGFFLVSNQTFKEPDTLFGSKHFPMAGTLLIFKKQ